MTMYNKDKAMDDAKRVNDTINSKFNKTLSKCCGVRTFYATSAGPGGFAVVKKCSKCYKTIKQ